MELVEHDKKLKNDRTKNETSKVEEYGEKYITRRVGTQIVNTEEYTFGRLYFLAMKMREENSKGARNGRDIE